METTPPVMPNGETPNESSSPIKGQRSRRWILGTTVVAGVGAVGIATGSAFLGSDGGGPATSATGRSPRSLIRGAQVFDGERTTARADILIEGGKIVDSRGTVDLEIDGSGRTLLPGLIDAHTHVFAGSLAEALAFGVTTELDMFCPPSILPEQRRLAAERDDVADLRSAGTLATPPGGHPSQLLASLADTGQPELSEAAQPFDMIAGPGQASAFVDARLAEGADYFKIVIDDGASQGLSLPALTPDTVHALVQAAHSAELKVVAHALTAREVTIALDAGVDGLAHVWADVPESAESQQLAQRVRDQGVFVVSTLAYFEALEQQAQTADGARHGTFGNAMQAATSLHRAGVPMLAGTDATPFAPAHGSGLHRELALLTKVGLSNSEVLAAATSAPARHFGLGDRGRIAPGLRADLVLVDGDPTRDINATNSIVTVWKRGIRLRR
ncbi:amidohydrolase family protein [Brevibacterium picturae]|uniref:Amidohydrolase family protein n=1 Tax=Brevibacterium picturae TaxID=260553 RepID=A0ABN2BZB7_9MICO